MVLCGKLLIYTKELHCVWKGQSSMVAFSGKRLSSQVQDARWSSVFHSPLSPL